MNYTIKKIFSLFCVFVFVVSITFSGFLSSPKKAEAVFVPVGDIVNLEFHSWQFLKENALDAVAFAAAKAATQQLVSNMISWVNSGFNGSPSFVVNEGAFISSLHDGIVVDLLIDETAALYAKAPFRDYVISTIAKDYSEKYSSSGYTLEDELGVANHAAFVQGDFLKGGWSGWYSLTQNPNNNYFGAQAKTKSEIARREALVQEAVKNDLDRGDGFFSLRDGNGNIITPGKLIESQLDLQLGTGLRQLEAADEFSELVSAAITSLAESVIQQGLTQATGAADNAVNNAVNSANSELNTLRNLVPNINSIKNDAINSGNNFVEEALTP